MRTEQSHLQTTVNHDGAAILNSRTGTITTLNSTGGFIWQRLRQGSSIEQAVLDLAVESDTDPAIVEKDVDAFLGQLRSMQLL